MMRLLAPLALAAATLPATVRPLTAQQAGDPNPLLTFNFSSSLNVSDNYDLSPDKPGTSTFLDNTLGVAYSSETDTQLLRFGISGVLRASDLPRSGTGTDFDNQTLSLDYRITGVDSDLALRANYNRSDLAFFDPLDFIQPEDPLDENDLVTERTGYRATTNAGVTFRTGLSSPLGFTVSADTRQRDFVDSNDPGLFDSVTNTVSAGVNARVTPVTALSLSGVVSDYSADDDEDTRRLNRSLSLGVVQETGAALTFTGSIGYQVIDTDEDDIFGRRFSSRNDGVIGSLGVDRELTNGTIGLAFSHTITTNGGRDTLQVKRAIDLPQGALSLALGVTQGDAGRTSGIGDISYRSELPSGQITLGLSRSVQTSRDNEELEVTRLRLGWIYDLTALSSLELSADYANTRGIGNDDTDRGRGRARAAYSHALTEDWNVSGGYEYTVSNRQDRDADENTLFLTIGRQFKVRP